MSEPKKVIVAGGESLLAGYLKSNNNVNFYKFSSDKLDVTSFKSIVNIIEENFNPGDVVLNCAAFTNVARAELESNKNLVKSVNVDGPRNLAEACKHYGLSLIHISTDYVYNGLLNDSINYSRHFNHVKYEKPLNEYGKSKLMGEHAILEVMDENSNALIVRTSGLYGHNGKKRTFLHKLLDKVISKETTQIEIFEDQTMWFTYAKHLAKWLTAYIESNDVFKDDLFKKYGQILNVVNSTSEQAYMRYLPCFVDKYLEFMGLDDLKWKINKVKFSDNVPCKDGVFRPKNSALFYEIGYDDLEFTKRLGYKMPSPETALKKFCLENYKNLMESSYAECKMHGETLEDIDYDF